MKDYLVKALGFNGEIRAYALRATDTVAEAQRRHDTWSTSTAALGRTLIAGVLLGTSVKGEATATIKVMGNGLAGAIVVDANTKGEVKGYIQEPHVSLPLNPDGKIDVKGAVGTEGVLSVTRDLGMGEPFTGQVPLVSGELGEDFTYYMAVSEQIPSSIGLSVLVNPDETILAAGGFMIKVLPGASEASLAVIEQNLSNLPLVSQLIESGKTPEEILTTILGEENIEFLETMPVMFKCDCSKEKFGKAIVSLGEPEIQAMIDEDAGAEAVCHFCGEKYQFSVEDLEALKALAIAKKESDESDER